MFDTLVRPAPIRPVCVCASYRSIRPTREETRKFLLFVTDAKTFIFVGGLARSHAREICSMEKSRFANLFSKKKRRKKKSTIRSFQSFERTKSVKRVIPRFLLLGVDPIFQRFVCRVRSHNRDNHPLSPDTRRIIFFLFFLYIYTY